MDAKTLAAWHAEKRDELASAIKRLDSGVEDNWIMSSIRAAQHDFHKRAADLIERQAAELAALRAERDALRDDAERYRWLRDCASGFDAVGDPDNLISVWYGRPDKFSNAPTLDEAIDAARAGGGK